MLAVVVARRSWLLRFFSLLPTRDSVRGCLVEEETAHETERAIENFVRD